MSMHRTISIDDIKVFYREAGDPNSPSVLLLHGFPTSSLMFRQLMPLLADRYHVVAPDLPGFGFTEAPGRDEFAYTFENLTLLVERFVEAIGLRRFAMYVFDYGAPIGQRLAMRRPEWVTALITQNGNAYEEGLSEGWTPVRAYWTAPDAAKREAVRVFYTLDAIRFQYLHGVAEPSLVAPETYTLDHALLSRPGNHEVQLDLILDYRNNVALYPAFQAYFRSARPPLLAVWGRNDPFFLPAGAQAFARDLPGARICLFDTGHFALETHCREIAAEIGLFLEEALTR